MKLFLTGEIQVGKSTVIAKTLMILKLTPKGFRTYFGPDRGFPDRLLYMNSADKPMIYTRGHAVAIFTKGNPPQILTEKFDTFGVELIRSARTSAKLILMDECGSLERDAHLFQKEILDTLEDSIPVLGVIKQANNGWTNIIRNHPNVRLFTVTAENRDELPQLLAEQLAQLI